MNSGYYPVVVSPGIRPQTNDIQPPFFFGGSQVPHSLGVSGSGIMGAFLGKDGKVHTPSKTHKGDLDFTTKRGDKVFHRDGHFIKTFGRPFKHKGGVQRK